MNEQQIALAEKILAQVERHPETLYMGAWEVTGNYDLYDWKTGEPVEGCGTTRCIAGWAVHFASNPGEDLPTARRRIFVEAGLASNSYTTVGAHLLGLATDEAENLFLSLDEEEAVDFLRAKVEEARRAMPQS